VSVGVGIAAVGPDGIGHVGPADVSLYDRPMPDHRATP